MNKAILIGNLGRDPEIRFLTNGTAVAKMSLATVERWTKDGEKREQTDWHNVVVYGKQGENCGTYLGKGSKVCVEGKIRTRNWDSKDGSKKYITEIIADRVEFLSSRPSAGDSLSEAGASESSASGVGDDEIPF